MSVDFRGIYGNDQIKKLFSESIENGNMLHAFILEGADGSGKSTFALEIACAMGCSAGEISCRKIRSGNSPDVFTLSLPEDRATISVDLVREIRQSVFSVPCELNFKLYIIRDSDKMTVQAQNALLKILEEPPLDVYFILLCENSSVLLPTIISRAPVFRMQRFTTEELSDYLLENSKDARVIFDKNHEAFEHLVKASEGTIGKAIANMAKKALNKTGKQYDNVYTFFTALVSARKSDFIKCEDLLPSKRDEFSSVISEIRLALRDILKAKKGSENEYLFFSNIQDAQRYSKALTADAIEKMIVLSDDALRSNEQSANMNLLRINYLRAMWKTAHGG